MKGEIQICLREYIPGTGACIVVENKSSWKQLLNVYCREGEVETETTQLYYNENNVHISSETALPANIKWYKVQWSIKFQHSSQEPVYQWVPSCESEKAPGGGYIMGLVSPLTTLITRANSDWLLLIGPPQYSDEVHWAPSAYWRLGHFYILYGIDNL